MSNSFFLPYFSATESHELTHLLSSGCPWGKHILLMLQPECYCSHLAQHRHLLSHLGPHFSIISLRPRPPRTRLAQGPCDCDKTPSCCINKSGFRQATASLWGKSILPTKASSSTQFPQGLCYLWGRHSRSENSDLKNKNNKKKEGTSGLLSRHYGI